MSLFLIYITRNLQRSCCAKPKGSKFLLQFLAPAKQYDHSPEITFIELKTVAKASQNLIDFFLPPNTREDSLKWHVYAHS